LEAERGSRRLLLFPLARGARDRQSIKERVDPPLKVSEGLMHEVKAGGC